MSLDEDIAQEKALAALEGKAFDATRFGQRNRPLIEVLTDDVDAVGFVGRRAPFEREMASNRDAALRPILKTLLDEGATMRQIAAELTRLRVPKCYRKTAPWSAQGAHAVLVRLGLAKSERRRSVCVCGKRLILPRARKFCSDECRHRWHSLERACR